MVAGTELTIWVGGQYASEANPVENKSHTLSFENARSLALGSALVASAAALLY